jgi:lysyl-tRNA synthetase class 2
LSHATITDPYVVGIPAQFQMRGETDFKMMYLQTSPEYAMKRLLAAGSGPIYQICKAFRQGDLGRMHNPEFTMIEWYRPGFDHHALMDEMDALLSVILGTPPATRLRYAELFREQLQIDPHTVTLSELAAVARRLQIHVVDSISEKDVWLDILWTHHLEPRVSNDKPLFLYDFPASQAALAKIRDTEPPVASRFEVYFRGLELANGFHELQDAEEQERRFMADLNYRQKHGLPSMPVDTRLLAALAKGLPDCAGVALGIDRLFMLALECKTVADVISFGFDRA